MRRPWIPFGLRTKVIREYLQSPCCFQSPSAHLAFEVMVSGFFPSENSRKASTRKQQQPSSTTVSATNGTSSILQPSGNFSNRLQTAQGLQGNPPRERQELLSIAQPANDPIRPYLPTPKSSLDHSSTRQQQATRTEGVFRTLSSSASSTQQTPLDPAPLASSRLSCASSAFNTFTVAGEIRTAISENCLDNATYLIFLSRNGWLCSSIVARTGTITTAAMERRRHGTRSH